MKRVKTYSSRLEADVAKITLEAAGVPASVIGVGLAMEGGAEGVQLLVPDEHFETALSILERS